MDGMTVMEAIDPEAAVGLCLRCRHVHVVLARAGRTYYRCERSATDGDYVRYPRLPVHRCPGYESADPPAPDGGGSAAGGRDRESGKAVGERAGAR